MSRLRHLVCEALHLFGETEFEQAIGLIVDHKFNCVEGQTGLLDAVHKSARRGYDNVRVKYESLELVLEVTATSDQDVSQVRELRHHLHIGSSLHCDFTSR